MGVHSYICHRDPLRIVNGNVVCACRGILRNYWYEFEETSEWRKKNTARFLCGLSFKKKNLILVRRGTYGVHLRVINPYPANVENMGASNNASRWQMGFNSAFKGLN